MKVTDPNYFACFPTKLLLEYMDKKTDREYVSEEFVEALELELDKRATLERKTDQWMKGFKPSPVPDTLEEWMK